MGKGYTFVLLVGLLVPGTLLAPPQAAPTYPSPDTPENRFATSYNMWLVEHTSTPRGALNVHEVTLWQDVKRDWKVLQRQVDEQYR